MIMMTYEEFNVPQVYYDECLKLHKTLFINDYYKKHKIYPPEDIINKVALSEERRERIKRLKYAEYLVSGNIPQEPNTPIIPPAGDDNTIIPNNDEWFILKYDVTTTQVPTKLFNEESIEDIDILLVDGIRYDNVYEYKFDTIGIHEVCVLLKNNTVNGSLKFKDIESLLELYIPRSIVELNKEFVWSCGKLNKIYCYNENAPSISINWDNNNNIKPTFYAMKYNGELYVPDTQSYNFSWCSTNTDNYSLISRYNWKRKSLVIN